jgi:outer membrane protein assembly factor BamB
MSSGIWRAQLRSWTTFRWTWTIACLVAALTGTAVRAEDWPQYRGPNCTGVSHSSLPLPVTFSDTENVVWSRELGEGIASPTVVAGRVFSTAMLVEQGGERSFVVYALDAATGDELWRRAFPAGPEPLAPIHEVNSYASATPAADGERVYVYFTRLGLAALDAGSGEIVWQFDVPEPFFIFDWGPGMSPVLHEDLLLFCQDDDLSPALYALDKRTGRLVWKDDRSDMAVCYSHPVICQTDSGPEIVVAGTGKVIGYDPATGKRKWAAALFCRNIKTTPAVQGDIAYLSVESYGISYQWRATADPDGDGRITRDEIRASRKRPDDPIPDAFWRKFDRGDSNGDGILEGDEIDRAFLDPSNQGGLLAAAVQERGGDETDVNKFDDELQKEASIQAVRAGGTGDVTATHVLWKIVNKAPDHLVSPLLAEGRLFLIKRGALSSLFEASTGDAVWYRERIDGEGSYLASPVYGDGKVYVTGDKGDIVVLKLGDEPEVLACNEMGEQCVNCPAIADGRLFIRTRTRMFCVGEER